MRIEPLIRFVEDDEGTRWAVVFTAPQLYGSSFRVRHQVVFHTDGRRLVANHDWVSDPPSPARLRALLAVARTQDS